MKQQNRQGFFKEKITRLHLLSLVGMICFFLVLRWNSFTVPFERDEGEYAYSAWLMNHHVMPYEHSFLQKPPMIVYLYMACQYISEDSIVLPRIFASLSLVLTILLTGTIVARERNLGVGISAMWMMPTMLSSIALGPFAANTEMFMLLPLMLVVFFYVWKRGEQAIPVWLAAGCCTAIACLFKPIAAPPLLFILVVWALEIRKISRQNSPVLIYALSVAAGTLGTSLLIVSPFLLHDGGRSLRECVLEYNSVYINSDETGLQSLTFYLDYFWRNWWVIVLLLAWCIIKRPARWWVYLGLLAAGLLTIYRMPFGHYYFLLIPFLAIIAAFALDSIFHQVTMFSKREDAWKRVLIVAAIVLVLTIPNFDLLTQSPGELIKTAYGDDNPFIEAQVMAKKLQEITAPTDRVFIAGSEPEIYYYAKRECSSRFDIIYPLILPTPVAAQYQEETIKSLEVTPPDVIIFVYSPKSWLLNKNSPRTFNNYIGQLLSAHYTIVGGTLSDVKEWVASPSEQQRRRCSMIVLKRSS